MSEIFSKRRMYNLLKPDGRALIVALDHALGLDVHPALADPGRVIDQVVEGGADALLTSVGVARSYYHNIRHLGLILRADGGSSELSGNEAGSELLLSAEAASAAGADGLACMLLPGTPLESKTFGNVARLASECSRCGMVLMAEVLPGGFSQPALHTARNIRLGCRMAAELGADLVKTCYSAGFAEVVAGCYRPIVVLGGSRVADEAALFRMVREALEAGASGLAFGRNVWQHPKPSALLSALALLVHRNASVEEALERLA